MKFASEKLVVKAQKKGFNLDVHAYSTYVNKEELVQWLRESHKIHVSAVAWLSKIPLTRYYEANIIDEEDSWSCFQTDSYSVNYEECLEAAISRGIDLITKF